MCGRPHTRTSRPWWSARPPRVTSSLPPRLVRRPWWCAPPLNAIASQGGGRIIRRRRHAPLPGYGAWRAITGGRRVLTAGPAVAYRGDDLRAAAVRGDVWRGFSSLPFLHAASHAGNA